MNSWENKGHFQNLLELEDDASAGNRTRWRYGPFLSTWLNRPGPKDYLQLPRLPKNETDAPLEGERLSSLGAAAPPVCLTLPSHPDLAFDWHINWNTATPFKLALGAATFTWTQGQEVSKNLTEYRAAASHDHAELLSEEFFRDSASQADFPSLVHRRPVWHPFQSGNASTHPLRRQLPRCCVDVPCMAVSVVWPSYNPIVS
jgi:hypothetical protein